MRYEPCTGIIELISNKFTIFQEIPGYVRSNMKMCTNWDIENILQHVSHEFCISL